MRPVTDVEITTRLGNPLDLVEQIVAEQEWPFERQGSDELTVGVSGRYCEHQMWFSWREELGAMSFTCAFDMKLPPNRKRDLHSLLAYVNEKALIGHFDYWSEEGMVVFRQALLLRGGLGATTEQIEDLMEIGLGECERFYPAFQFLVWGGRSPEEAVAAAMFDTVGEA
ncbi:YbjN domain-containing protein [Ferrovibrio sp.]|uniref:YbjN domain-containing protein n=1 Tax=Ferrovibrio sp. TaxID=1917215 RepID=UPI001B537CAB|nr:YbjN domain-containing protein [Ferrovibrio sp.]MBP7064678.1 YbjN domain-containing protein [Ferrovibrio sp.]